MQIVEVDRGQVEHAALSRIEVTETVLDIGPGIQPQTFFRPRIHLCVEAYAPYIARIRSERPQDSQLMYLNGTWQEVLRFLPDKSVDSAFALDLIEHLAKEEGFGLLDELSRLARRQIVVFTPLGMYPQSYEDGERDRWGMGGTYWQTHRSGWVPEDFVRLGDDWQVVVCPEYYFHDQHGEPFVHPVGALWAFRNLANPAPDAKTAWDIADQQRRRAKAIGHVQKLKRFIQAPVSTSVRILKRARWDVGS